MEPSHCATRPGGVHLSDLEHMILLATSPRRLGRTGHVELLLLLGDRPEFVLHAGAIMPVGGPGSGLQGIRSSVFTEALSAALSDRAVCIGTRQSLITQPFILAAIMSK